MDGWRVLSITLTSFFPFVLLGLGLLIYRDWGRHSSAEMPAAPRDPSTALRFLRDVFVNLLANLVAAALIYLAAAAGGLVPASPYLVFSAVVVLLLGASVVIGAVGLAMRRDYRGYTLMAVALLIGGVAALALPFVEAAELNLAQKIVTPISGVGAIAIAVGVLRGVRSRSGRE